MDNSENKTVPNVTCNGTRLSPLEQSVCNNCALFFTCRCGDFTKDGGCLHCCDGYGVPHYLETWWTSLNFRIVIEAFKNAWKKSKTNLCQFSENYAKNFPADFIKNLNN